jgi:2-hydroxy-3-oxopropionate reductase
VTVSVVGLGLMGRPLARNLGQAGFTVRGWNRSPLDPELTRDVPLAATLEEAAGSELLVLILANSAATGEVLDVLQPHLRPGHLVVDMGSSDPRDSIERARGLADRGVGWVDAPVSGGMTGAESGRLAIMAGGSDADVARALPVLEALGENVVHVGGVGAGHTAKTANQLIVGLTLEAVAEALVLAESRGVDPRLLQQALRGGWADSRILREQGERMIERDYVPGGKVETLLKDLRLAGALAGDEGLELPHLKSGAALFSALVERGDGELDCAAVVEPLRQRSLREKPNTPSPPTSSV